MRKLLLRWWCNEFGLDETLTIIDNLVNQNAEKFIEPWESELSSNPVPL